MKNIFILIIALITCFVSNAQSPEKFSFQAVVIDNTDSPIINQAVGLRISLLEDSASGTLAYQETHTSTTTSNALISVEIGNGTTTDDFTTLDWSAHSYYAKAEFDVDNNGSYDIENTSQLLSVPYALHAKTADSVVNMSGTNTGDQDISGIATNAAAIAANVVFTTTNNTTSAGDVNDDFVFGSSQLNDISGSEDDDNRMFFDKSKGAFRVGNSDTTKWDDTNVGEFSTAVGHNTTASGTASVALGWNSIASGSQSMSIGNNSNAQGYSSIAMGEKTTAETYGQTTLGLYNTAQTGNQTAHINNDRLLVVGNGYDESNRSDALVILKNGNTVIDGELKANKLEVDGAFALPTTDGTANQTLSTNGSGVVSWVTQTVPTTYSIGDVAQGGVVFWVDETGQHGLVVSMVDQSTGIRWNAGTNGNTQAKGAGIYAGKSNTAIIIAAHVAIGDDGTTYAARLCNEYEFAQNGVNYGDWYLPSRSELFLIHTNSDAGLVSNTLQANGGDGFGTQDYWSSTEVDGTGASYLHFDFLFTPDRRDKTTLYGVRAIRSF